MLELRGVKKVYDTNGVKRTALKKINLAFRDAEFAAILGPSGSGKTTLLNIIGGLDKYTKGDLLVNGRSTKQFKDKDWDAYRNHRIGFVFQNYNLIPHQTVLQNVRLALTLSGVSKKESVRRAKRALKEVGLEEHIDKRPAQLSGGQMQRVAIARALVNNPDIVLADEPTGALDSETSVQIMQILKDVSKDKLVIMVTHNAELADEYATRIITLKDGEITSDSNPVSKEEGIPAKEAKKPGRKPRHTKMTFWTALSLSTRNLLTKKARTLLISIAGSIGIIGIALISAVSTGFQNYIDTIEKETLTSYPLTLMEESADLTGILLSITGQGESSGNEQKVTENQVLTGALGSVSHNDLQSFMEYYNEHKSETESDVRLVENEYNVDPLIYTVDKTGQLAKLNPSDLFSSLIGESSLLNNYSSLTSVFQQQELANMQEESKLVAGRWPEKYNELVISLANPSVIPDLMTYSLGFHDTSQLNEILTKIMSGEATNIQEEPLELSYDELMAADLRLVPATATYKYNEKYNVYEDMSEDSEFMRNVYENQSEKLKIVGIVTPSGSMSATGNGVFYLPSLVTHIIDEAGKTEIVQRQLAEPDTNIFSNSPFGEDKNDFDFEFSDLVSVDNDAIQKAFGTTIDPNQVAAVTQEYMGGIQEDINIGTDEVPTAQEDITKKVRGMATALVDCIKNAANSNPEFAQQLRDYVDPQKSTDEVKTAVNAKISELTDQFMATQNFQDLQSKYTIPSEYLMPAMTGLMKGWAAAATPVIGGELLREDITNMFPDMSPELLNQQFGELPSVDDTLEKYMGNKDIIDAINVLSTTAAKFYLAQTILTRVGNLTQYLSSTFANAIHVDQDALLGAFKLNFTEEELTRVISAMFNQEEVTLSSNLSTLGYQDLNKPTRIAFYFSSFDGKTEFMKFLDNYNDQMRETDEEKVIEYSDTTGVLMSSVKVIVDAVSYVLIAFVSISLIVSSIMIGVITYISVYERTKEIGILRAMGASKHNISSIFNAETVIIGFLAGIFGVVISYLLIPPINLVLHHFTGDIPLNAALAPGTAVALVALSIVLTLIGGLIPAHSASKKDPVEALRSE